MSVMFSVAYCNASAHAEEIVDGMEEGALVGYSVGRFVLLKPNARGYAVGKALGFAVGWDNGWPVGTEEGTPRGWYEGIV